jgi:methylated-DNA-protein-cysteine methyltransferase related protein
MRRRSAGRADDDPPGSRFDRAVYAVVRRIPRGRVATYSQVAAILGQPRAARAVGTALSRLPQMLTHSVPWQRVINARGRLSDRGDILRPEIQRKLLEAERVEFSPTGEVDLQRFRWMEPRRERPSRTRAEL